MTNIIATKAGVSVPAIITLTEKRGEHRVDSRLIAQAMGNQHKASIQLIERYKPELREFGLVPFEMEKVPLGRPEKFALLNEDQALFLLALSKNTKRVVELKLRLVKAFSEARRAAELHGEYLHGYHELHDQLHRLADGSPNERWAHANLNKLLNKTAGIEPGQRPRAGVPQKALLTLAGHVATQALQGATDSKDGYGRVKAALEPLARIGGPQ